MHSLKARGQRKCDQQRDDDPRVVQSDFDAEKASQLDIRLHSHLLRPKTPGEILGTHRLLRNARSFASSSCDRDVCRILRPVPLISSSTLSGVALCTRTNSVELPGFMFAVSCFIYPRT